MSSTVILSTEQIAEARELRESDDLTYAALAKKFGVKQHEMVDALKGQGDYAPPPEAPKSALDALVAQAEELGPLDQMTDDPDVHAAKNDRQLTGEEVDKLEILYRTGRYSFETMAEALDPPVNWLTVQDALGARGWYRPDYKTITYSTSTPEGQQRYANEMNRAGIRPLVNAPIDEDVGVEARAITKEREAAVLGRVAAHQAADARAAEADEAQHAAA